MAVPKSGREEEPLHPSGRVVGRHHNAPRLGQVSGLSRHCDGERVGAGGQGLVVAPGLRLDSRGEHPAARVVIVNGDAQRGGESHSAHATGYNPPQREPQSYQASSQSITYLTQLLEDILSYPAQKPPFHTELRSYLRRPESSMKQFPLSIGAHAPVIPSAGILTHYIICQIQSLIASRHLVWIRRANEQ